MNNDENKIMGIGEIINQTASEVYRSPSAVVTHANATVPTPPPIERSCDALLASFGVSPNSIPSRGGGTPSEVYRSNKSSVANVKFNIFSDRNYARYIYIGHSHYARREELERNHTQSAQYINEHLANIITITTPQTSRPIQHPPTPLSIIENTERLLFKGPRHMKRGSGITLFQIHQKTPKPGKIEILSPNS
jgi:hypothetical protein